MGVKLDTINWPRIANLTNNCHPNKKINWNVWHFFQVTGVLFCTICTCTFEDRVKADCLVDWHPPTEFFSCWFNNSSIITRYCTLLWFKLNMITSEYCTQNLFLVIIGVLLSNQHETFSLLNGQLCISRYSLILQTLQDVGSHL
jgi:hypothetical protein